MSRTSERRRRSACLVLALLAGCSDAGSVAEPCAEVDVEAPDVLRWRRLGALMGALSGALDLPQDDLCREVGGARCADLHRTSLGGNDPFQEGIYTPVAAPLPVTPAVVDRVVLNACIRRVELDRAGTPVVFTALDLAAPALDSGDDAVRADVNALFRRLLARDPSDAEVDVVAALAADVPAAEFAVLACYAVGTTTELVLL